jgi:hypothetical protein
MRRLAMARPERSGRLVNSHMSFYRFIGKATSVRKQALQKRIAQQNKGRPPDREETLHKGA